MGQKINANKSYPFYAAFHDDAYISRHDCCKIVSLRELHESRIYKLNNPNEKEIVLYRIDGGVIKNNDVLKCDYGILTEDNVLFFIELKGAELDHALDQIISTIDILLKQKRISVSTLYARIVLSKVKVPNIVETKERKLKQLLHNNYGGGTYCRKTQLFDESI